MLNGAKTETSRIDKGNRESFSVWREFNLKTIKRWQLDLTRRLGPSSEMEDSRRITFLVFVTSAIVSKRNLH